MRPDRAYRSALAFIGPDPALHADADGRLPAIATLAARAGVSAETMRKAVATLRSQGALDVRPGRGIHLPGRSASRLTATLHGPRPLTWERVRSAIVTDLYRRTFPAGAVLPPAKELAVRYGCCHRTLVRATDSLVRAGLLAFQNRRLVYPAQRASVARNTIVVIVRGTASGDAVPIGTWAPRNRSQFEALEHYAAEAGCRLAFAVYRYEGLELRGPGGGRMLPARLRDRPDVLGFLLWNQGLGDLRVADYALELERSGKPVAVLDVGGSRNEELARLAGRRLCRVFALGTDQRCGEIVGSYLLGLGHRKVDYLGRSADALPRLAGLRRVYGEAGLSEGVTAHSLAQPDAGVLRDDVDREYRKMLRHVRATPGARLLDAFLVRERERLVDRAHWQGQIEALRPVVQVALSRRTGTALVCEDDALALYCLALVRRMGVRVPEQCSVVGFDDEEEAFLCGLSSYNFNVAGVIAAMVDFVVRPHSASSPADGGPVVIDGYVKARTTTAPPGQAREWILP